MTNRFLYRYYGKDEYLLDVVINKRLYSCLPSEFNDPFDCRPLISIKYSNRTNQTTWHKLMYYMAMGQYPYLPPSELTKHADAALEKGLHKKPTWLSQLEESLKNVGALVRVCCFAKSPRNTMMWAHYARNHSGVAFQFRTAGLMDHRSGEFRGFDVTYIPSSVTVEELVYALERGFEHNDPLEMARLMYTTKTNDWVSENEVRFFSPLERSYIPFEESTLSGVIFGDKCSEFLVRKILSSLGRWRKLPRLFRVSIKRSSLKLWIQNYRTT
jgi:hypothetical protein